MSAEALVQIAGRRTVRKREQNSTFPDTGVTAMLGCMGSRWTAAEMGVRRHTRLVSGSFFESDLPEQIEVRVHRERRRRWTAADKLRIVEEAFAPGAVAKRVAERYEISTGLLFTWRRQLTVKASAGFLPVQLTADGAGTPVASRAKRGGGKRTVSMREVVNGVMYVLSTGCQWRYIPKDLPPRSTLSPDPPAHRARQENHRNGPCHHQSARRQGEPPERLLSLSHEHWGIENCLHYVRDVTCREDQARTNAGHAPEALGPFATRHWPCCAGWASNRPRASNTSLNIASKPSTPYSAGEPNDPALLPSPLLLPGIIGQKSPDVRGFAIWRSLFFLLLGPRMPGPASDSWSGERARSSSNITTGTCSPRSSAADVTSSILHAVKGTGQLS